MIKFSEVPEIQTDRLILRQLKQGDNSVIYAIRASKEIGKYLDRPLYRSIIEADEFIKKINHGIEKEEWLYWAICKKFDQLCFGTICLWNLSDNKSKADIGFELLPDYQKKGYISEAAEAVIKFGFEQMQLKRIYGEVDPNNSRSIRLMKKLGFTLADSTSELNENIATEIYILKNPAL